MPINWRRSFWVARILAVCLLCWGCGDDVSISLSTGGITTASPESNTDTGSGSDTMPDPTTAGPTSDLPSEPVCGDGMIEEEEECDEGPDNDDYGTCTSTCHQARCGDDFVQPGEECDHGPMNDFSSECKDNCKWNVCGDGFILIGEEACDDGNQNTQDDCPDGPEGNCQPATCGDGYLQKGVEVCDNGGENADHAACTTECKVAVCGDGFVYPAYESCDDGNTLKGDGCSKCKFDVNGWCVPVPENNPGLVNDACLLCLQTIPECCEALEVCNKTDDCMTHWIGCPKVSGWSECNYDNKTDAWQAALGVWACAAQYKPECLDVCKVPNNFP